MKAKNLWVFLAGFAFLAGSCRHHSHNRMVSNDGVKGVEVRYDGDIEFNDDETSIARISERGYLEYRRNDDHLLAGNNDSGVLKMELYENGKPLDPGSAEG